MREQWFKASLSLRDVLEGNKSAIAKAGYLGFDNFPEGCCGYSNHLLAHYLISLSLCSAQRMKFPYNNYDRNFEWGFASHGWILIDEKWNVDITADQFEGIDDRVIVSDDSPFHKRFVRGEWVSFEEKHYRQTWHDEGVSFRKVWALIQRCL